MLCYRCGSHVQDGAENCWNCGTKLAAQASQKSGAVAVVDARAKQATKSRISGVVYKIGDLIANRYMVKDITGSGGAGVVYRAHDQEIDVDVALKVINAKLIQTPEEKRLFSRETKAARKLSHQNIVRIYDEGKDADRSFFTMQFLEGLSLRKIIDLRKDKNQRFSLAEIEPIYNQLCQALDYAHRTTFHGDLKPDNVIVLPDLLKVTDFGLLKGLPRKPFLAIQKARGHNLRYLAPEVRLEVSDITASSDIYSLGVILFEMLAGIVYDDAKPESLAISAQEMDPTLNAIVRRCLARVPKERYASSGDLYEELRAILAKGGDALTVRPNPMPPPEPAVESTEAASPPGEKPSRETAHPEPISVAPLDKPAPDKDAEPTEAPTQRLDIQMHGERPVKDEEPKRPKTPPPAPAEDDHKPAIVAAQPAPPNEATGTFAPIDDDMIESQSGATGEASGLPVPPLVSEEPHVEEEPTEALPDPEPYPDSNEGFEPLLELSGSEIELVADPRKTGVIDIDPERMAAKKSKEARSEPASVGPSQAKAGQNGETGKHRSMERQSAVNPATVSAPPEKGDAKGPFQGQVIVDFDAVKGSAPDHAAPAQGFADAGESTHAGRLDEPVPIAAKVRKPSAPPIVRGVPASEAMVAADAADAQPTVEGGEPPAEVVAAIAAAQEPATGKATPKNPVVALHDPEVSAPPAPANGAAKVDGIAVKEARSARARPMTRPRMQALSKSPSSPPAPAAQTSGGGVAVAEAPQRHAALHPSPSVRPPAHAARGKDNRPVITAVIFVLLAIAGMFALYMKIDADRKEELRVLQEQIANLNSVKEAARRNEAQASEEAARAAREAKAAAEKEAEAERQAQLEAIKREAAEAEARRVEKEAATAATRQKEELAAAAAEKRRQADAAAEAEKEARKQAAAERLKRQREELAEKQAAERAQREAAAQSKAEKAAAKLQAEQKAREAREAREAEAAAAKTAKEEARREEERRLAEKRAAEKAEQAAAEKAAAEKAAAEKAEKAAAEKAAAEKAEKASGESAPVAAAVAPAAGGGGSCPKGMAFIAGGAFMMGAPRNDPERNFGDMRYESTDVGGFCIDYYESPNGRGRAPVVNVSFKEAEKQCKSRGKRLCTEAEWEKACKGPSGMRYPYGNQWDPTACATEDDEGNDRQVSQSGTFKACRSGYNVFDLSGNVAEWTSSQWAGGGGYVVKGGSATRPGYDARCAARKNTKPASTSDNLGFRCCSEPQ